MRESGSGGESGDKTECCVLTRFEKAAYPAGKKKKKGTRKKKGTGVIETLACTLNCATHVEHGAR